MQNATQKADAPVVKWQGYPGFLMYMNRFLALPALLAAIPPIAFFVVLGAGIFWPVLFGLFVAAAITNIVACSVALGRSKPKNRKLGVVIIVTSALYIVWIALLVRAAYQF